MYIKDPKNRNITVRVTNQQYKEFNAIAASNGLSTSNWANILISNFRNSYKEGSLSYEINELERVKKTLIKRVLEKFEISNNEEYECSKSLQITQIKLAIEILDMTRFKSDKDIDELIYNYRCLFLRQLI